MVSGRFRSRTYRRTHVVTPGGRNVLRHTLRKPKKAHCAECGGLLHGIARARPADLRKMTKSQRGPSRMHAGKLCTKCSRRAIIASLR